jgi:hypothetical protein
MQLVLEAPFLGVKQQGREADHTPPASTEVKKMWINTGSVVVVAVVVVVVVVVVVEFI